MSEKSFGKSFRLRKREDFERLLKRGKRQAFSFFWIFSLKNEQSIPRLGIIVPKKKFL
ncbi:MAG: ribonuclease P protein component [Deltaproteobacteria bacterium]|nr:ribonuclease P protein component [Deltaproteobacteria bacterium]